MIIQKLDVAKETDQLEQHFNETVQQAKNAGASLSNGMTLVIESMRDKTSKKPASNRNHEEIGLAFLKSELDNLVETTEGIMKSNGIELIINKEIDQTKIREIALSRMKIELNTLAEAAGAILKIRKINLIEDSINKKIAEDILGEMDYAKDWLDEHMICYKEEKVLLATFGKFEDRIDFLISTTNSLHKIELQKNVARVIEESEIFVFNNKRWLTIRNVLESLPMGLFIYALLLFCAHNLISQMYLV